MWVVDKSGKAESNKNDHPGWSMTSASIANATGPLCSSCRVVICVESRFEFDREAKIYMNG